MSAFAQKVIVKLEEPLQKKQWGTIQARCSTLKEEYSEIEDWLYNTEWKNGGVPQWIWEIELQIDGLLDRVEYACRNQQENNIVAGWGLENALKFEITEIKRLLRTEHYTYE
jgi:DNA-binding ferritin-like protein (Dps family)